MAQQPIETFGRGKNVTRPQATYIGSDKITLSWTADQDELEKDCSYEVYYKEHNKGRWKPYNTDEPWKSDSILITNLKAETSYVFKVKIVSDGTDDEGPFSPNSAVIKTCTFQHRGIPDGCKLISSKPIQMYQLNVKEDMGVRNEEMKIRKFILGQHTPQHQEKTILLVGATGSGKSTLVNALANYILGVRWEETFRFILINRESDELHNTQAVSQTSWVTCYKLYTGPSSALNYNVNIIDTPGFGHTDGLEYDTNILSQLKELFQSSDRYNVSFINAVCMVVKAPDARLTQSQQYIFKSVLSLFGKDIVENMCTIVTFADCQEPPVIAALAALEDTPLPYKLYFPVNNSALYADNGTQAVMTSTCWMLGNRSFSTFFAHLENLRTQSLSLTVSVMSFRDAVDNTILQLKEVLGATLGDIDTIQREINRKTQGRN